MQDRVPPGTGSRVGPRALTGCLEAASGVAVADLVPLPGGESARSFRAIGADGWRWFVKVVAPDPYSPRDLVRFGAAVQLRVALRGRVRAAEIITLIPTHPLR
ncbi:MAG: hypothetical protein ACRDI2_09090 [Chloroflexota bacterium]